MATDKDAIEKLVIEKLAMVAKKDQDAITSETLLQEDLGLKSIDYVGLSATLENELGDAPNFKEMLGMQKVGDIVDFCAKLQG
jgi:acyl carrier protein